MRKIVAAHDEKRMSKTKTERQGVRKFARASMANNSDSPDKGDAARGRREMGNGTEGARKQRPALAAVVLNDGEGANMCRKYE